MRLARLGAILFLTGAGIMVSGIVPAEAQTSLHPRSVRAGTVRTNTPPTTVAYDIAAANAYCTGGGSSCIQAAPGDLISLDQGTCYDETTLTNVGCVGLNLGDVYATGPLTGATWGTPSFLGLDCVRYTASGKDYAYAYAATPAYVAATGHFGNYPGVIGGNGNLFSWYQENPNYPSDSGEGNTAQVSSLMASLYHPAGQNTPAASGSVTGIQNTDNTTDNLNSGSFRITIRGTISHYDLSGTFEGTTIGTMSCEAGGPHAYDVVNTFRLIGGGVYFEGEMELAVTD